MDKETEHSADNGKDMARCLYVRPVAGNTKVNSKLWTKFEAELFAATRTVFSGVDCHYYSHRSVLGEAIRIIDKVRSGRFDIIICYGFNRLSFLICLLKLLRILPQFTFLLEFAYFGDLSALKNKLLGQLLKKLDVIGVCSDYEVGRYARELALDRGLFRNIVAPIESDYYECHGSASGSPFVLSAGRGYRDYRTLLKAANDLPEIQFVVISDKESISDSDYIPDNVTMLYEVHRDKYFELLRDSAVVVVPLIESRRAAGHQVIYQAMAMGKPVVATRTETTVEILTNDSNGILCEVGDSVSLADSIKALWGDQATSMALSKAAKADSHQYTIEAYCRAIKKIYCERSSFA